MKRIDYYVAIALIPRLLFCSLFTINCRFLRKTDAVGNVVVEQRRSATVCNNSGGFMVRLLRNIAMFASF
jgi:hypothetical protein